MIIQKMNNVLVKHGKITFAIITLIIIVSFVFYLGSINVFDFFTYGSFSLGGGSGSKYGSVLGKDISKNDVGNARQSVWIFCAATHGLSPRSVQTPDEDWSFFFGALAKAADVLNIQVSDKEVRDLIQTMPAFQEDGKYSNRLYNEYRDQRLAPSELGFSDLENAVRTMIRMKKVPGSDRFLQEYLVGNGYINSIEFLDFYRLFFEGIPEIMADNVVMSDSEAETAMESMLQKITYHMITFAPAAFEDQVKVEDYEVNDFYAAHESLFMSEPESDGLLVFVPYTVKKNELDEEQLKDYYEGHKAFFINENNEELPFDEVKDEIRKELETVVEYDDAIDKAQAFNKAFRTALNADKEEGNPANPQKRFLEEAKKAGLPVTTVKNITAKTREDEELHIDSQLVRAITILKNVGSHTNLQQGEHGVSMFLLTARRPSVVQPFEDVKDIAREYVVAQKENAMADEAGSQLSLKFLDLKDASAASVEELVKSLNGTWHAENTLSRLDLMGNKYRQGTNEILTTGVGKLSSPNKDSGAPMFVFVSAHTPATAEELAEQKEFLGSVVKTLKEDAVSQGLQAWVLGSAQNTSRHAQAQE